MSKPAEEPEAEQKEEIEPAKAKKPVGGVAMFGGVNLFAGEPPPLSEPTEIPKEAGNEEVKGEKRNKFPYETFISAVRTSYSGALCSVF